MTGQEETIVVFAARYAHGRNTGAALAVVSHIKNVWHDLSIIAREQIISESHEAQFCDGDWESLRDFAMEK